MTFLKDRHMFVYFNQHMTYAAKLYASLTFSILFFWENYRCIVCLIKSICELTTHFQPLKLLFLNYNSYYYYYFKDYF